MSAKVCAIIQGRMGSSRLPGKVLKPILEKPMLIRMVERVSCAHLLNEIIIATTDSDMDEEIVDVCKKNGLSYFCGSEDDVLDRYYQTARTFGTDVIVRLTADLPLIDPAVIDYVVNEFLTGEYDYVANTEPLPSTYPDGMDVMVFSFKALKQAWHEAVKPSDREHVTFYFWNHPEKFRIHRVKHDPDWSEYRLTVDYPEDFELVKAVFENLYPNNPFFTLKDIVGFLESNPNIKKLNRHIVRNIGWQKAFEKDRKVGF